MTFFLDGIFPAEAQLALSSRHRAACDRLVLPAFPRPSGSLPSPSVLLLREVHGPGLRYSEPK